MKDYELLSHLEQLLNHIKNCIDPTHISSKPTSLTKQLDQAALWCCEERKRLTAEAAQLPASNLSQTISNHLAEIDKLATFLCLFRNP